MCVCVSVSVSMCACVVCVHVSTCVCVMHTCMYVQFNSYRKELMNNTLIPMLMTLKEDLMVYCRLLSALM